MNVDGFAVWARSNEHLLTGVCVAVIAAFGAAVALSGWVYGFGCVAGGLGWLAVCAGTNRAERREHDSTDRELLRRPS